MSSRFPNPDTLSFSLSSSAFLLRLQTMIIMIIISLLISPAIFAAGMNIDVPTRSEVLSQLDALSKQKILSPAEKLSQQDLTKTLEYLDTIERTKQEAAQLKQQLT
ncbi:potassium efflux protein KefA [Yersinia enterocolitica]|nr:potassium efflux protein KefA [Yersinia enterocolitica]